MRYKFPDMLRQAYEKLRYQKMEQESMKDFLDRVLWDLYVNQKHSLKKIEQMIPLSYWSILMHLHDMNAPMRSRGGANNYRHGKYVGWWEKREQKKRQKEKEDVH